MPHSLKLAIIEDNEGVAELMLRHLRSLFPGAKTLVAHTLQEAWAIIALEQKFDVIFLDLNLLPDSPAERTVQQIPDLLKHCNQLIVVTGHDAPELQQQAVKFGASGYMEKAESLVSTKSFIEKMISIYRALRPPAEIDKNLDRLRQILESRSTPPQDHGPQAEPS